MSGSGNSGGNPYMGGSPSQNVDCKKTRGRGLVNSPDPSVLVKLSVKDTLTITIKSVTGPIIAKTSSGEDLGSVLTTIMSEIIHCINEGYEFEGEILNISGGKCELLIFAI